MPPTEPPVSRAYQRRPSRILLVDDEPSVIRGLWRILRQNRPEYHVNTAANPLQAIEALYELGYDLVLTDWHMPGGGGRVALDPLALRYPETGCVVPSSQIAPGDPL